MTSPYDLPEPDPVWFLRPNGEDGSLGIHGLMHTRRVMIHAGEIATALEVEPRVREAADILGIQELLERKPDRKSVV